MTRVEFAEWMMGERLPEWQRKTLTELDVTGAPFTYTQSHPLAPLERMRDAYVAARLTPIIERTQKILRKRGLLAVED